MYPTAISTDCWYKSCARTTEGRFRGVNSLASSIDLVFRGLVLTESGGEVVREFDDLLPSGKAASSVGLSSRNLPVWKG